MFTLVWIIALLGVSSDTILRRAVNMSIDFMMTMMMTKEEEKNRFKMHIYYHFCWLEDFTMEVFPMKFNDKETGRSFGNHCGTQFIFYPCFSDWEQNIFERNLWERTVWNIWSIFPPKTEPRLKNNKWRGRQFIVENN